MNEAINNVITEMIPGVYFICVGNYEDTNGVLCPVEFADLPFQPQRLFVVKPVKPDDPNRALFIGPSVWSLQIYRNSVSIPLVLSSEPFDESDYLDRETAAVFVADTT